MQLTPTDIRPRPWNSAADGNGRASEGLGFHPAFLDTATMTIYLSRFADGRRAPFHMLDGLPCDVVIDRLPSGRAVAAKASIIAGFERGGFFYTREAAARARAEWASAS